MSLPQPQAWDRNIETRETPTAFRAFMDYCRMGTKRSLRALVERYTESDLIQQQASNLQAEKPPTIYVNTLFGWSLRHHWQKRVRYWDTHQERLRTEQHNEVIADMNRRHAQIGMIAQQKGLAKLTGLLEADLSVNEGTRLVVEGSKMERLARGEPVTIETHEHRGPDGGPVPIKYVIVHLSSEEKHDGQDGHDGHDGRDGGDGSQAATEASALDS